MPAFDLRLFTDRLSAEATSPQLPAARRTLYVVEGEANVRTGGQSRTIRVNEALYCGDDVVVSAPNGPVRLLRWELADFPAGQPMLVSAAGIDSMLTLSHLVALHPWTRYLVRCDRVDFPRGGQALTHVHPGPGIRCVLKGNIEIRSEGRHTRYREGEAWFEIGPEPVFAQASDDVETSFVRLAVLPRALEGINSIEYIDPADRARPKSQRYQRFFDIPLDL